jgi:hypothetical protein
MTTQLFALLADGLTWTDSDGNDTWDERDVTALAEAVGNLGYQVDVVPL